MPLNRDDHDGLLATPNVDGGTNDGSHGGRIGEEGHHVVIIHALIRFDESDRPVFGEMHHKGRSSLEGAVLCNVVPLADQLQWQDVGDADGIDPGVVLFEAWEIANCIHSGHSCRTVYFRLARPLSDI